MATIVYDDYGRTSSDPNFGSRSEVPEPYIVNRIDSGITYICFADTPTRCVRRIIEAEDVTTVEFSIGNWEERANLVYQPVNTTMEISE